MKINRLGCIEGQLFESNFDNPYICCSFNPTDSPRPKQFQLDRHGPRPHDTKTDICNASSVQLIEVVTELTSKQK